MSGPGPAPEARESLAGLGKQFAQEELRSSARILIMLSLGVNQRLSFSTLLELTHCAKGSLSYHLKQLENAGLLQTSMVFTFGGPRVIADITEKGRAQYRGLIDELRRLPGPEEPSAAVPS